MKQSKHSEDSATNKEVKKWKPKLKERYYIICLQGGRWSTQVTWWYDMSLNKSALKSGNCFKTVAEAKEKIKELKQMMGDN